MEFQIEVACKREVVWLAWTQTERVVQWFAPAAHVDAQQGGAFELFFDPENRDRMCTKGCTITRWEPMERLGFTWKGPDEFAELMNDEESLTTVLVTLAEQNGSTTVTIEHTGWGTGSEWEQARSWHQMAWKQVLGSLKSALESGTGDICCTPNKQG